MSLGDGVPPNSKCKRRSWSSSEPFSSARRANDDGSSAKKRSAVRITTAVERVARRTHHMHVYLTLHPPTVRVPCRCELFCPFLVRCAGFTEAQRAWFDEELTSYRPTDEKTGLIVSRDADFEDFKKRWAKEQRQARDELALVNWLSKKEKVEREQHEQDVASWEGEYWRKRTAEAEKMRQRERARRQAERAETDARWLKARKELEDAAQQQTNDAEKREAMRRARGEAEWRQITEARQRADALAKSRALLNNDDVFKRSMQAKQRREAQAEKAERRAKRESKNAFKKMAEERAAAERAEQQKRLEARRQFHEAQRRRSAERELDREKAAREADEREAGDALRRAARLKDEARQSSDRARQAQDELAKALAAARIAGSGGGGGASSTALVTVASVRDEFVPRTAREERMHQLYGSVRGSAKQQRPRTAW